MTFRHFFTFVLGIVLALTLVPAAQAANLFIDDSVEAEITLNHDPNWEFGALSNETPFPGVVTGSTTAPGEVATFSGSWFVISPGNPDPGAGVIYFVDQATKKNSCKRRGDRGDRRRRHRRVCVSDIVTANWRTSRGQPLRQSRHLFHGHFKRMWPEPGSVASTVRRPRSPDPASPVEISGLFRNLVTAAPVAIPSNLTVQFWGNADTACKSDDDKGQTTTTGTTDDKDGRLRTQRPSANEGRAARAVLPHMG